MIANRWNTVVAAAGTLAVAGVATANDELLARVAQLENEVRTLRGADATLDEARADEIRSMVADVLADADTRSSLLQSNRVNGWNNGFVLGSPDGNFTLRMNAIAQVRFIASLQDNSPAGAGGDDSRYGFENNRTRLTFSGNIVDPSWLYKLQFEFGSDGAATLLDAYVAKKLNDNLILGAGQVKVPMLRETLIGADKVQGVARSVVEGEFGAGRTQGVIAYYNTDQWRFSGAVTDGHGNVGGFNQPWNNADTDVSLTGRGEFLVAGEWADFADITSAPGQEFAAMVGGSFHYQTGESGTAANEVEAIQWTVDGSIEGDGWNVFAYVVSRTLDNDATVDLDQTAFVVQGGIYLNDDWELFGRYEWADMDIAGAEDLSIVTIGATNYISGHNLKFTADVGYALDPVPAAFQTGGLANGSLSTGSGSNVGWREDAAGEDGQLVLRAQMQLAF